MMKRVLVTGGGGFVGTALVRQLLDCGCEVSVAGRNCYPDLEQLGVCCLVGDIAERDFGERICQGHFFGLIRSRHFILSINNKIFIIFN